MTKTIRDKLEFALDRRGYKQDKPVGNAHVWYDPKNGQERKVFLGTSGSLRVGRIKSATEPLDTMKEALLTEYATLSAPGAGLRTR